MLSEIAEYAFDVFAVVGEAIIRLRQEPKKDNVYISSGRVVVEGLPGESANFPVSEYFETPYGIIERSFMSDGSSYDIDTVKERTVSSDELSSEVLSALNELSEITA